MLYRGAGLYVTPSGLFPPRRVTYSLPFSDGNYVALNALTPMPTNQWTHVAVTWDNVSGHFQIYINGALNQNAGSVGIGKTLPTQAQRNFNGSTLTDKLGCWDFIPSSGTGSSSRYAGAAMTVDDFRLYNRALTASEIQLIYSLEPPVITNVVSTNCMTIDATTTNLDLCTTPKGELTIFDTSPGSVNLEWPAQSNVFYLLQSSDALAPLSWEQLWAGTGTGTNVIVNDPTVPRQKRFYRLLSNQ